MSDQTLRSAPPADQDPMLKSTGRSPASVFAAGAGIGALGGLIGLGGAEFRLPLLIGLFRFDARSGDSQ
jgi:hypothetical protein